MTANGLASIIKQNSADNYISVCDKPCVFDEETSTATVTKCKVPQLSTVYSNENFEISKISENLKGKTFGTDDYELAFDDVLILGSDALNGNCNLGMEFKEGHVGLLSQVKYFLKGISKPRMVDRTKFQGSMDGVTYVDLFTLTDQVHEGWNYVNWEDDEKPNFRFYKFQGNINRGCKFNEVTFTGVETIDSSSASHTCPAKLVTGSTETPLEDVEYVGSLTPALTAIEPRHGTVVGGDSVTFTGTQMSSDTSKYTIIIDGIVCDVTAATTTSVTCTTNKRPGLIPTSLYIFIDGQGLVSNRGLVFTYVNMWSQDTTWGGEFAPMEMESIWIPEGLNLYVDVDATPVLNAIIVEGSLIFASHTDPMH